jgi:dCMP deaminase
VNRPDWDPYFLGIAVAVSARGECTRRQVGAVIVNEHHRLVKPGYNGAAAGERSCLQGACPRGRFTEAELPGGGAGGNNDYETGSSLCIAIHAEANAIMEAGRAACIGCTIYVTCEPCQPCRNLIRGAGIVRAVWPGGEWVSIR